LIGLKFAVDANLHHTPRTNRSGWDLTWPGQEDAMRVKASHRGTTPECGNKA